MRDCGARLFSPELADGWRLVIPAAIIQNPLVWEGMAAVSWESAMADARVFTLMDMRTLHQ
jgi:hypothetical protein